MVRFSIVAMIVHFILGSQSIAGIIEVDSSDGRISIKTTFGIWLYLQVRHERTFNIECAYKAMHAKNNMFPFVA